MEQPTKPQWHVDILAALGSSTKSINYLASDSENGKEIFDLLHDLAKLPNVLITKKNLGSVKSIIRQTVISKRVIDTLVMIIPKQTSNQALFDILEQLTYGLLIDCQINDRECEFDPFTILIIRDSLPSLHMVKSLNVNVFTSNEYYRNIYQEVMNR